MRLTKFTDLALRVTMRLAAIDDGEAPTSQEVATSVAASYTHITKVVSRLQHLGIIHARRGRGGGLSITSNGRQTSVGWLVRQLEGSGDIVGCEESPRCPLIGFCRLRIALRQAQEAFYSSLDSLTIQDLVTIPSASTPLHLTPPSRR